VPVLSNINNEQKKKAAEIIAIRTSQDKNEEYYVHYVGFNKRLDEWVAKDRIIIAAPSDIEYPKKKKTSKKEEPKEKAPETGASLTTEEIYKVKNIETIEMGEFKVDAWYFSPYPFELAKNRSIVLCEYCLFYMQTQEDLKRHREKCKITRPPGAQIYRKDGLSFFELDGQVHANYTRNLSLLSKLFLDHKTLYYDVDVFLFYVMCIYDVEEKEEDRKYRIVGYFSKEKETQHGYNVACVLVLPQYQRKGYGKLLIDFSYLLSKRERVAASPEKPLSDLGLLSYRQYWTEKILEILLESKSVSINDIRDMSSITTEDVIHTLQSNNMLMFYNGVSSFVLREELLEKYQKTKKQTKLDPEYLKWTPPYM